MVVKLLSRNQLTLPKALMADFQGTEYFEAANDDGRITLTPLRVTRMDAVHRKLAELGVTEADVADAVAWARRP